MTHLTLSSIPKFKPTKVRRTQFMRALAACFVTDISHLAEDLELPDDNKATVAEVARRVRTQLLSYFDRIDLLSTHVVEQSIDMIPHLTAGGMTDGAPPTTMYVAFEGLRLVPEPVWTLMQTWAVADIKRPRRKR